MPPESVRAVTENFLTQRISALYNERVMNTGAAPTVCS